MGDICIFTKHAQVKTMKCEVMLLHLYNHFSGRETESCVYPRNPQVSLLKSFPPTLEETTILNLWQL